jgi:UDP-N-acetylmuramoyl-tripeptide--D-alanyl-D-alanine ligase
VGLPNPVLTVAQVADAVGGRVLRGDPHTCVHRVVTDSRASSPGALFVALRGRARDGHAFVGDAARRGARAALVCEPVAVEVPQVWVPDTRASLLPLARRWRAELPAVAVGVTGSVGKTTTVAMTAAVLRRRYPTWASEPDWNAELGVPLTLFGATAAHRYVVVEMAMRGLGQIAQLAAVVRPQVGVVTCVGPSHLELLGSLEAVARAKAELVEALPPEGVAVLNADDPRVLGMARLTRARVLRFGFAADADVRAEDVQPEGPGMRFRVRTPEGSASVFLPVPAPQLVHNALAALAVGQVCGVPLEEGARALVHFRTPPLRLSVAELEGGGVLVNDAYNASPQSLEAAFAAVRALRGGRRVVAVLGEMRELGPLASRAHEEAGARCAREGFAVLIAVGEGARALAGAARESGLPAEAVVWVRDAEEASAALSARVRPGDLVLVKGSRALGLERVVEGLERR